MKKYLLAGLLVWLPLAITFWVLHSVLGMLDGLFAWALSASQAVLPADDDDDGVAAAAAGVLLGAAAPAVPDAASLAAGASPDDLGAAAVASPGTPWAEPRKSVTYQPEPLSWKPAAVTCFLKLSAPHSGHTVSSGSDIFCSTSFAWPHASQR